MSDDFSITFQTAHDVKEQMTKTNKKMTTDLEDMIKRVDGMTEAWTGEAKMAYDDAKDVWRSSAAEMAGALAQASAALDAILEHYAQADLRNASSFGSLH